MSTNRLGMDLLTNGFYAALALLGQSKQKLVYDNAAILLAMTIADNVLVSIRTEADL